MTRSTSIAFAALFLAVVALPLAGILRPVGGDGVLAEEKRRLRPFPEVAWSASGLAVLPEGFEAWFRDRFGFRSALIRLHSQIQFRLLRAGSQSVVVGDDGWLYLADSTRGVLEQHRGFHRLTPDELDAWTAYLERTAQRFAERGIVFVFAFAPSKPTIYPEHLPHWLGARIGETPLDQLLDHVRRETDVPVLDLRTGLRAAKASGQAYYRTDTHWTDRGAFAAHEAIVGRVAEHFPDLEPLSRADLEGRPKPDYSGDLAALMHLDGSLLEPAERLAPDSRRRARAVNVDGAVPADIRRDLRKVALWETDREAPRAVLFGDSFLNAVAPFLATAFRETHHVHRASLHAAYVDWARPDVVVQQVVERSIWRPPADPWSEPPPVAAGE